MKIILAAALCSAHPALACPDPRETLCRGPVAFIADNDPGLTLFKVGTLADRKVALAIERANSCDPAERMPGRKTR